MTRALTLADCLPRDELGKPIGSRSIREDDRPGVRVWVADRAVGHGTLIENLTHPVVLVRFDDDVITQIDLTMTVAVALPSDGEAQEIMRQENARADKRSVLARAIERLMNVHGVDNETDTPDFILAAEVMALLDRKRIAAKREKWFGGGPWAWSKSGARGGDQS